MPILNIVLNQHHTPNQKQQLLQGVSQAVVDSIGAPLANVRATVQTIDPQDSIVAGQIGTPMAQVDVYLLPGRTEDQKAALIAALSKTVADTIQVSDQNSRIIIQDIPLTDMGVAGGISAKAAAR